MRHDVDIKMIDSMRFIAKLVRLMTFKDDGFYIFGSSFSSVLRFLFDNCTGIKLSLDNVSEVCAVCMPCICIK